jgi:hypothetical protein
MLTICNLGYNANMIHCQFLHSPLWHPPDRGLCPGALCKLGGGDDPRIEALDAYDPGRASGVTDPIMGSFSFLKGGMRMGKFFE